MDYVGGMLWRLFQLSIVVAFCFANIYYRWGADGLAAGVMGGMVAWYATFLISLALWKSGLGPRFGIEAKPSITLLYRPPSMPAEPERTSRQLEDRP